MQPIYTSLDASVKQIRTLVLQPAVFRNDSIYCRLETSSLLSRDRSACEALSYTWGTATERRNIYVNGASFQVTRNLDVALRHLRWTIAPRRLWIDAICINQSDIPERNAQVEQMRDIYAGASQVLVWLGEGDSETNAALKFAIQHNNFLDSTTPRETFATHRFLTEPKLPQILRGYSTIFQSPWWSRVWVVQEVVVPEMPPLIGCGDHWISLEAFSCVVGEISELAFSRQNPIVATHAPLLADWEFFHTRSQLESLQLLPRGESLEDILLYTAEREATDPKDRIFGVLGLLDNLDPNILVDYALPVEHIYQQAMMNSFYRYGDVELILQAIETKDKGLDLPSWCIDFSQKDWNARPGEQSLLANVASNHPDLNERGLGLRCSPHHNLETGEILVDGSIISKICITAELAATPQQSDEWRKNNWCSSDPREEQIPFFAWVNNLHDLRVKSQIEFPTQQESRAFFAAGRFWSFLSSVQSLNHGLISRPTFHSRSQNLRQDVENKGHWSWTRDCVVLERLWVQTPIRRLHTFKGTDLKTIADVTDPYLYESKAAAVKPDPYETNSVDDKGEKVDYDHIDDLTVLIGMLHRLYKDNSDIVALFTVDRRIGKASAAIQEGDMVCMLHGCSRPVVLRESRDDSGSHMLIARAEGTDMFDGPEFDEAVKRLHVREIRLR